MQNYKKIYENQIGKKIPKNYEIHHIDLDRNNNSFDNLVMLPRELHNEYHRLLCMLPKDKLNLKIQSIIDGGNGYNDYYIGILKDFVDIKKECDKWCDYKYYLCGYIPNIHNIEVDYGNI